MKLKCCYGRGKWVGYADIVPMTVLAKLIVVLEVALHFFVLVFGIANINQIRINQN